jgi:hypothetical protein
MTPEESNLLTTDDSPALIRMFIQFWHVFLVKTMPKQNFGETCE